MALNNLRPEQAGMCTTSTQDGRDIRTRNQGGGVLGETSATFRVSFEILKNLFRVYREAEGRALKYKEMKNSTARISIEGFPSQMSFIRALFAVREMEEAPWFTRMWVLQEVALASSVSLVCGRQTSPWDYFEKAMLVRALVTTQDRMARKALSRQLDHGVLKVIELRMAVADGRQDRSILSLLSQFRGHKAGIAAGKVYAILSMTGTKVDDIGLRIDYGIPTARLFTDLAKGILLNAPAGGLDILSVPRVKSEMASEMPSWVPD
ncbi:hypothetical protein OQA88_10652 [Cercophora sp. LCS_1]